MVWRHLPRSAVPCAAALCCLASPALAQEPSDPAKAPPPIAAITDGKQVYTPADFARFAPKTAMDMLRQVPGFNIVFATQDRGLGQASENVLLNGERIANKSGGAQAELQRIGADQVERIEIVSGATLNISGLSGQVANVVTKSTKKASGQFAWYPQFRPEHADQLVTNGSISYSGTSGPVDYTLGFENNAGREGAGDGMTTIRNASGEATAFQQDSWKNNYDRPKVSGRVTVDGPGSSTIGANAAYAIRRSTYREETAESEVGSIDSSRSIRTFDKGWDLELGSDLSVDLGGGKLKLIGLLEINDSPSRTTSISAADGANPVGSLFTSDNRTKEAIGRGEFGWKWGGTDMQLAAEAAFNNLDGERHLFLLGTSGLFAETPFPGGSGSVSEDRYELLGTIGRALSPKLTLQLTAGGEYSALTALGRERTFLRPKGNLALAWQIDARTDVSLKIARVVGQLNFYDFLASINFSDENSNAGNIDLVPQQSWEAKLEFRRNLGAWGSTRIEFYGNWISDILEIVPIGPDRESVGNVDHATQAGISWRSTLLLDPLGWKGAKLNALFRIQTSSLRDPLTGETRRISNDLRGKVSIDFRHDIPGSSWAWGGALYYWNYAPYVRLTEFSRGWFDPADTNLFIENKDVAGLTVGLTVSNLLGADDRFTRTVYDGRRTDPLSFVLDRKRSSGLTFSFSVRGNF